MPRLEAPDQLRRPRHVLAAHRIGITGIVGSRRVLGSANLSPCRPLVVAAMDLAAEVTVIDCGEPRTHRGVGERHRHGHSLEPDEGEVVVGEGE